MMILLMIFLLIIALFVLYLNTTFVVNLIKRVENDPLHEFFYLGFSPIWGIAWFFPSGLIDHKYTPLLVLLIVLPLVAYCLSKEYIVKVPSWAIHLIVKPLLLFGVVFYPILFFIFITSEITLVAVVLLIGFPVISLIPAAILLFKEFLSVHKRMEKEDLRGVKALLQSKLASVLLLFPIKYIVEFISNNVSIEELFSTKKGSLLHLIDPLETTAGGCYIITASQKGHPLIIKPIKMGVRRGEEIIINHQLAIFKTFEFFLMERYPTIHKVIRRIYNRIGPVIAQQINTKWKADLVCILMKPLEYTFEMLLFLSGKKMKKNIYIKKVK